MLDRMDRVTEAVKRELALIIQEEVEDPRIIDFLITRVEITRDLHHAKVHYTTEAGEKEKAAMQKALTRAARFIRKQLALRLQMKYTPMLSFAEDKEDRRNEHIDRLFKRIEEELSSRREGDTEGEVKG